MKSCEVCGFQMFDRESVCPNCGTVDEGGRTKSKTSGNDSVKFYMAALAFFIPLIGLIAFFVKKNKQPNAARVYLSVAVISWLLGLVFSIVAFDRLQKIAESNYYRVQYEYNRNYDFSGK
jgi:hypothetical protein